MADSKNTEQIALKAEETEKQVVQTMENIETSKAGKNLPTEIHSIHIHDILKITLFINICNFIPLYVLFGRALEYRVFEYIRKVLSLLFIIFSFSGFLCTFVGYFAGSEELYKFVLFSMVGKAALTLVLMIMTVATRSWFDIFLSLIYVLCLDILDFILLYYLAIFFKRANSDEFDENGVRIQKDEKV